jgi:hypothetical protein
MTIGTNIQARLARIRCDAVTTSDYLVMYGVATRVRAITHIPPDNIVFDIIDGEGIVRHVEEVASKYIAVYRPC